MKSNRKTKKNTKKTTKKKSSRAIVITAVILAVLLAAGLFLLLRRGGKERPGPGTDTESRSPEVTFAPPETEESALSLGEGVRVTSVGRYAGFFVEDGSDEIVSGIAMVTVKNEGTKNVQLLSFTMKDDRGGEYEFQLTTLFPGDEMTVLEKNRKAYDREATMISAVPAALALFSEEPSLHGDVLRLYSSENGITVENISGNTLPEGKLYYKNLSGGLLVGGITYSVSFPSLAPGEKKNLNPKHYTDDGSRISFIVFSESAS